MFSAPVVKLDLLLGTFLLFFQARLLRPIWRLNAKLMRICLGLGLVLPALVFANSTVIWHKKETIGAGRRSDDATVNCGQVELF
jgi:hypothetical protein